MLPAMGEDKVPGAWQDAQVSEWELVYTRGHRLVLGLSTPLPQTWHCVQSRTKTLWGRVWERGHG